MGRHSATKGSTIHKDNMRRYTEDLVMTRQQFKESPVWTITGLDKPLKIKDRGSVKWVVLEADKYEALMDKIMELGSDGRR